jgi:hypothetical protein
MSEYLKRAQKILEEKAADLAASQAAMLRGQELVSALEEQLDALRNRTVSANLLRSEQIVAWASSNEPLPDRREGRLVDSADEIGISNELGASLAARADLLRDVNECEEARRVAEANLNAAAVAALVAEGVDLAAQLIVSKRLTWLLEDRLNGLAATWIPQQPGQPPQAIRLPDLIQNALQLERAHTAGNRIAAVPWASTLWTELFTRLLTNADAEWEPRDAELRVLQPHELPRQVFKSFGDAQAERLAVERAAGLETQAEKPLPGEVQSAINLARLRGQMQ